VQRTSLPDRSLGWYEKPVFLTKTGLPDQSLGWYKQEAQLSLTNRAILVCKVVEVWQDFLWEYVNKKFTYICYRRLIRHE